MAYKLKASVEENEEAVKNGGEFGPITAERAFSTLRDRRYEPAGKPITRITGLLGDLNTVIWREIGLGERTPQWMRGLVREERIESERLGRDLANHEMFDYFRVANIVGNRKINKVIVRHCLSVDFIKKVGRQ